MNAINDRKIAFLPENTRGQLKDWQECQGQGSNAKPNTGKKPRRQEQRGKRTLLRYPAGEGPLERGLQIQWR